MKFIEIEDELNIEYFLSIDEIKMVTRLPDGKVKICLKTEQLTYITLPDSYSYEEIKDKLRKLND